LLPKLCHGVSQFGVKLLFTSCQPFVGSLFRFIGWAAHVGLGE
jgi:hypothetical protein